MNNLLLMGSALYSYINTQGTITTYYQKAPQSAQPPFVIVSFVSATDDYTFDSNGMNADYFIKVVGSKVFPESTISLYGAVHDLIQDAPITITGNNLLRIRRESIMQYQDSEDFWNVGGLYNLDTWKT